jgi:hypothetical protein
MCFCLTFIIVSWEAKGNTAELKDYATLTLFGKDLHEPVLAKVNFIGPGALNYFEFTLPKLGKILLFQTHTPEEPLLQKVEFRWYSGMAIVSMRF